MLKTYRLVKQKKALTILSVFCMMLFNLQALTETPRQTVETPPNQVNCHLKMGWVLWPPYQYIDHAGEFTGLQVTLFKNIAKQVNCQLTFIQGDWPTIQSGIKAGTIDMMGNATITPTRQKFAYFSSPYRPEILALYVTNTKLKQYPQGTLKELMQKGFRIALVKDNYYGETIESLKKNPQLKGLFHPFKHNHDSYHASIQGQIDGLIEDPMVHAYTVYLLGYEKLLVRHQVIVTNSTVSLMFSKKTISPQMVERFNAAIEKVKLTVEYQQHWSW
jgi:polar amino acid transport system substrate-binding protein